MEPGELTGAAVRAARERLKMSREAFVERTGLAGVSRLANIERKDSWKPGDRELLVAALAELDAGQGTLPVGDGHAEGSVGRSTETTVRTDVFDAARERLRAAHDAGQHTGYVMNCPTCDADRGNGDVWPWADAGPEDAVWLGSDDETSWVPQAVLDEATVTRESPPDVLADLPTNVLVMTNSQRATAQRCPRRWWLSWYRRLQPKSEDPTSYRATGDRVHRALAAWYVADPAARVDPRDALERALVEDWTRVVRQLGFASTDDALDDPRVRDLGVGFQDAANLERVMVEGYVEWVAETGADQDLIVTASETPLRANLGVVAGRPVVALGLLDVRVRRASDDVRLLVDHKTVGSLTQPVASLPLNEQMLHYHLLEWLNTPDGESRCDGALYNMLRRVKRTERARPPFYDRVEVRHSQAELDSYRRRLLAWSATIAGWTRRLDAGEHHLDVVPPVPVLGSGPASCKSTCDFFGICPLLDDPRARVEDALSSLYAESDPLVRYNSLR